VSLLTFTSYMRAAVGGTPYPHVMVIDGNDDRGIDVGILAKKGYGIVDIRSPRGRPERQ